MTHNIRLGLCLCMMMFSAPLFAQSTIRLNNGDLLSGTIIEQNDHTVRVQHEILGTLTIATENIAALTIEAAQEPPAAPAQTAATQQKQPVWTTEIAGGYTMTQGNTDNSALHSSLYINRKTEVDETTFKAHGNYTTSDDEVDSQDAYGMARYAHRLWTSQWYGFVKGELEHDKFEQIQYRVTPSTGIGYWFSDTDDWKALAEIAFGYEHTHHYDDIEDTDEAILIPRIFFEKRLFGESRFAQDFVMYPSLSKTGEYRIRSESSFTNPIGERWSLRISLIDDYNSDPADDRKHNDLNLISSILYSF